MNDAKPFVLVMGQGLTRRLVYAYDEESAILKFVTQLERGSGDALPPGATRLPRRIHLQRDEIVVRPATDEDLLEFKQKRRKRKKLDQLAWDV